MFLVVRIIYVKYTKKFRLKNSKLHVETCTYNIRLRYVEDGIPFAEIFLSPENILCS
jgi:hypothetical protein